MTRICRLPRKPKYYSVEPYHYSFSFCADEGEWKTLVKHSPYPLENYPSANATTTVVADDKGVEMSVVCIAPHVDKTDLLTQLSCLVHEGVHIWQNAKRYIGEETTGIEHEAYSIQKIVVNLTRDYLNKRGPREEEPVNTVDPAPQE